MNIHTANKLIVLSILILSLCSCGQNNSNTPTGPIALSFNLHTDSTYYYSVKNNVTLTQKNADNNKVSINQNMALTSSLNVAAEQPKQKNISVTYDRITLSTGNELYSIDYDSDNDNGADPMYDDLRQLIGKAFTMVIATNGKVNYAPLTKDNTNQTFKDSSIRQILMHCFAVYPSKTVAIGDIWDNIYITSVGFANIKIRTKYQLVSVENGIAHIELKGLIGTENTPQTQGNIMSLEGSQTGSVDMDITSGMILSSTVKQDISGTMNINNSQGTPVLITSDVYIIGSVQK